MNIPDNSFGMPKMPGGPGSNFEGGMPNTGPQSVRPEAGLGRPPLPPQLASEAEKRAAAIKLFQERKAAALKTQIEAEKKRVMAAQKSQESKPLSREDREVKLNGMLAKIAERQRGAGLPIGLDGRVDINYFRGASNFSEAVINTDNAIIASFQNKYKNQERGKGEEAERVTNALLAKLLPDCEIVGSSIIDDASINYSRHDSMFFSGGKIVCVFDIVCTARDKLRVDKKNDKAYQQNINGGAGAKYCFERDESGIALKSETNLPIFNIRIDPKMIDNLNFGRENNLTKSEMAILCSIFDQLYGQIKELNDLVDEGGIKFEPLAGGENLFEERLKKIKNILIEKISPEKAKESINKPEFAITAHF